MHNERYARQRRDVTLAQHFLEKVMSLSNSQNTFGSITKSFHWLTALLILAIIPLGLIANNAPLATSEELSNKAWLFSLHKTLGVTVFFVALLRIIWARTQRKPGSLHPNRKAENFLAETVHWLLYGSLVLAPLSGWIHHAATAGFAPIWWPFGQDLPLVPKSETIAETFSSLHWIWTKVMAASILLHVAGALKHQFIDRDATLSRMWFGNRAAPETSMHKTILTAPIAASLVFALTAGLMLQLQPAQHETANEANLASVQSDWSVVDGSISISVTQFGNTVPGNFSDWTSSISFDRQNGTGNVETQIAIGSLSLGSVTTQAMGGDFLDTENHAVATFEAAIAPNGDAYLASGTLTIKDVVMPIELPFTLSFEGERAFMSGETSVNRIDFNVGQSLPDESNLAFTVAIQIDVIADGPVQ
jgi:cytochrome b561/polyisoprenoid-binding protein YceI